jgi:hypothetical protein
VLCNAGSASSRDRVELLLPLIDFAFLFRLSAHLHCLFLFFRLYSDLPPSAEALFARLLALCLGP